MTDTEIELYGKMSRAEAKQLSPEQKKLRRRYQKRKYNENDKEKAKIRNKKYRETRKEQHKEYNKQYRETNKDKLAEKYKEYNKTPNGKKRHTLCKWKNYGLQETKEELDRIYNLWLSQELCNACDVLLTRNGSRCSTQACMDHCHTTHRFRHIICISCNSMDNWKKYFC